MLLIYSQFHKKNDESIENDNFETEKENETEKTYDIGDRTLQFGIKIMKISKEIPYQPIYSSIRFQIIKSGTAIGANLAEADGAKSKRDFVNKLAISRKEAKETKFWLCLLNGLNINKLKLDDDINEVQEIINILSAIINNTENNNRD